MTARKNIQPCIENDAETTTNNNLLYPESRANIPSTEASGQLNVSVEQPLEKRCYTVEDLQVILACGRETVYALLAAHEFRWFRLGGQRGPYRISRKSFDEWLDNSMGKEGDPNQQDNNVGP